MLTETDIMMTETNKTRYQVQSRSKTKANTNSWHSFNAPNNYWDLVDTLEDAQKLLEHAKEYHRNWESGKYPVKDRKEYEYRILKVETSVVMEDELTW